MIDALLLPAAVAIATSSVINFASKSIAPRFGWLDMPADDGLKVHTRAAVPLGGVGIFVGLHLGMLTAGILDTGFLIASLLLWLVGLFDDLRDLDPRTRLLAAIASALILVGYGVVPLGWLSGLGAVLVVLASVNAVNLLDGLDALAGSVTVTALLGLAVLGMTQGQTTLAISSVIAAGAIVGFLVWNLPPAGLFLGNNGAYLIGLSLGWVALRMGADWSSGLVAVAAIGVPFIDLGITVVRRTRSGATLFGGDRDHTYDRLHRGGWSVGGIAIWFSGVQALWSASVIAMAVILGNGIASAIAISVGVAVVLLVGLRDSSPLPTST